MKLLLIGPFRPGDLPESYALAFQDLGHEVFRFDSDRAYFQSAFFAANRYLRRLFRRHLWDRVNRTTTEVVRSVRPDLVVAFKTSYLDPETIRNIRIREHTPIVNYYPDNPYCGVPLDPRKTSALRSDLIDCLREYTHVFIWGEEMADKLRADRVKASCLPFGADIHYFKPGIRYRCPECDTEHDIAFVGQYNDKRQRHIDAVRRHDVALWHGSWERARRAFNGRHILHTHEVWGPQCAAAYFTAKVSLNVVSDINIPGHNMRTFEIPASGGVMLSVFTEAQAAIFPAGEAALYYRDPSEIDEILERAMGDDALRERIKNSALRIAAENTYEHRAKELIRYVKNEV